MLYGIIVGIKATPAALNAMHLVKVTITAVMFKLRCQSRLANRARNKKEKKKKKKKKKKRKTRRKFGRYAMLRGELRNKVKADLRPKMQFVPTGTPPVREDRNQM
ncbi:hypothetical protein K504DRAFT_38684 [Pleomassaria siparia CBS 279.74]|uniref:Uncharacterized protein n=1 Tax=Pleomassaria siparia CBS 279.74 TaxID=1314801 RepID=A0A6G1K528_9PLEO|nr:hypothetical protein K504DRAFT_38684 [Pleomassaria siparia CBS 279.74]